LEQVTPPATSNFANPSAAMVIVTCASSQTFQWSHAM